MLLYHTISTIMTQTTYRHAISSYNLHNAPFPALCVVFLFLAGRFSPFSSSFWTIPSPNTSILGFVGSLGRVSLFCACEFLSAVGLEIDDSGTCLAVVVAIASGARAVTAVDRFAWTSVNSRA